MCHIHFLKDALYLGPETEAVQKLLEGFPREIIWLESFGLEENREDCAEEMKKEACWLPTVFDPANTQVGLLAASCLQQHSGTSMDDTVRLPPNWSFCVSHHLSSRRRQSSILLTDNLTVPCV